MRTVIRFNKKCKRKPIVTGNTLDCLEIDARVEMIQALPLGLMHVEEELKREVTRLAGERYSRTGGQGGYYRWTRQWGSVYLADQKVPVRYQRVRDAQSNQEVRLVAYQRLLEPRHADSGLMLKVLRGLSCCSYEACAEAVPGVFGLSASSVS